MYTLVEEHVIPFANELNSLFQTKRLQTLIEKWPCIVKYPLSEKLHLDCQGNCKNINTLHYIFFTFYTSNHYCCDQIKCLSGFFMIVEIPLLIWKHHIDLISISCAYAFRHNLNIMATAFYQRQTVSIFNNVLIFFTGVESQKKPTHPPPPPPPPQYIIIEF